MTNSLKLAAALLLVTISACSSSASGPASSDGGDCAGRECSDAVTNTADATPGGCQSNADCSDGLCDPSTARCVPPCIDDTDCGPQAVCADEGLCVARRACDASTACGIGETCNTCDGVCQVAETGATPCTSDINCGFEQFCDPCLGECRDRLGLCDACQRDEECGEPGDQCLDFAAGGRFCGRQCGSCPIGYACDADVGQCLPLSGSCLEVAQCASGADCPVGQTCSEARLCVEGCTDSASCAGGLVCQAGACVAPCASAAGCPDGAECVDGVCVVPGGCSSSADCTEPATYCDRGSLQCVPGCEVDDDCMNAAQMCSGGVCVRRGCRGSWSCAFGEVCDRDAAACTTATGQYCEPCDGQDVDSCGATNACLTLEEDGAEVGAFCMVACSDDEANTCPQGYGCREVDLGDQGLRSVCVRACNRDPV